MYTYIAEGHKGKPCLEAAHRLHRQQHERASDDNGDRGKKPQPCVAVLRGRRQQFSHLARARLKRAGAHAQAQSSHHTLSVRTQASRYWPAPTFISSNSVPSSFRMRKHFSVHCSAEFEFQISPWLSLIMTMLPFSCKFNQGGKRKRARRGEHSCRPNRGAYS